ncbi:hypothetical protein [Constantimarinum furrinae]|uniref:HNH endonuclease n=1 Tax=Constantimarinum furrinae TaxID=2562285 RepID=A0A7G8PUX3_9FLAO|nr:hypothetical protein [Constantimarinum furrinae]QNJ98139.1 hypothetical protein ALE3EI_1582 [Constantimarinum furrinae]
MNLKELEINKSNAEITYNDLLCCQEWKEKRQEIFKRDEFKCSNCKRKRTFKMWSGGKAMYFELNKIEPQENESLIRSKEPINLEVHHNYYILNNFPWEYDDIALICVCRECHQEIHDNNKIPVWDQNKLNMLEFGPCDRCVGKGYLKEYKHVENGRCFKCSGSGYNLPFKFKPRT